MPFFPLFILLWFFSGFHSLKPLAKIPAQDLMVIEPKGIVKGNILFLNGWNMKADELCLHSSLCNLANEKGCRIFIPNMKKSVYASAYFNETRADYKKEKTLIWLMDTLLPNIISEYGAFKNNDHNFLIGISTGARGAVLLAAKMPNVFNTLILLSGDYEQCIDTSDNLMINTYGRHYKNPERWKTIDNPLNASSALNCNVFIGHGQKDKVVKAEHSYLLEKKLRNSLLMKSKKIEAYFPDSAGHDWKFWGEGMEKGMDFMLRNSKNR
jgi:S-formylglutathione hydrolase FrmB